MKNKFIGGIPFILIILLLSSSFLVYAQTPTRGTPPTVPASKFVTVAPGVRGVPPPLNATAAPLPFSPTLTPVVHTIIPTAAPIVTPAPTTPLSTIVTQVSPYGNDPCTYAGAPTVLFLGDSISTPQRWGQYADEVCTTEHWTRLNQQQWDGNFDGNFFSYYKTTNGAYPGGTLLRSFPMQAQPVAVENFIPRVGIRPVDNLVIYLGTNDFGSVNPYWNITDWQLAWDYLYTEISYMPHPPSHIYVIGLESIWFDTYHDPRLFAQDIIPLPRNDTYTYHGWATDKDDALRQMNAVTKSEAEHHDATYISLSGIDFDTMFTNYSNGARDVHPNAVGMHFIAQKILSAIP